MQVKVIRVGGLDIACEAVRLSFNSKPDKEYIKTSKQIDLWESDVELMKKLILSGDSHAKSMRMATVWLDLTMPRYWWSEADQCKVGFVTMSESTAHTLLGKVKKHELKVEDFEAPEDSTAPFIYSVIKDMEIAVAHGADIEELKQMLPESFLQRRIVCTNYQTLRHIYFDRRNHRLPIWHRFLDELLMQLPFPEFITIEKEK